MKHDSGLLGEQGDGRVRSGLDVVIESLDMRYEYDDVGRIVRVLGDGIFPRFVLGRSREGCVWRFSATLSPDLVRSVSRLAGREPGLAAAPGASPPERLVMIERLLSPEEAKADSVLTILAADGTGGVAVAELWTMT